MERSHSSRRTLFLAVLFVVVTLGLTTWVGLSGSRDDALVPAAKPDVSAVSALGTLPEGPPNARSEPNDAQRPSADTHDEAASGGLRLHCVDEITGEDLPGLTWVVASERGGDKLHATGLTDQQGRARIDGLPQNTLLVYTLRKPPHAEAFTAVWLRHGETRDIVLRVGAGARVHGRVVDDLRRPIPDVEIFVLNDYAPPFLPFDNPRTSTNVAARTDEQGRYSVENVSPRPFSVWVVDDEVRPESWSDVIVQARKDNSEGEASTPIRPGESKELPDIVFERLRTWRGRVVDVEGRGVDGALVSLNWLRGTTRFRAFGAAKPASRPPGSDGFALMQGETLTRPDGSFEVSSRITPQFTNVITPTGIGQTVQLPTLAPGESADDVIIRLKQASGVALELIDAAGEQARIPNPRIYQESSNLRSGRRRFNEPLRLVFSRDDDVFERATVTDDGVGGFVVQIDGRIEDMRSCSLVAKGWSQKTVTLSPRLKDGARLTIRLEDQPCVRVHLRLRGRVSPDEPKAGARVGLHACLLPIDARSKDSMACCGLGSTTSVQVLDGERDILLPVEARRPFHVYTSLNTKGRSNPSIDHGMFLPDGEPLTLEIDAADLLPPEQAQPATPPPATETGVTKNVGSLRATIVDAVTGQALKRPGVMLKAPNGETFPFHSVRPIVGNRVLDDRAPVGIWLARISEKGYRSAEGLPVEIREGETTDMGRIALEPAPRTVLIIEGSDGTPVPRDSAVIHLYDTDGSANFYNSGRIESDDGSVVFFVDVPDRLIVQVSADDTSTQWIPIRRDPDATIVRMGPWRDVNVRVTGAAARYPGSNLTIRIRPELSSAAGVTERPIRRELAELDVPANGYRLFRGRLGPGRYVVEGTSPLFQIVSRAFEVAPGQDPVRVEVESME